MTLHCDITTMMRVMLSDGTLLKPSSENAYGLLGKPADDLFVTASFFYYNFSSYNVVKCLNSGWARAFPFVVSALCIFKSIHNSSFYDLVTKQRINFVGDTVITKYRKWLKESGRIQTHLSFM